MIRVLQVTSKLFRGGAESFIMNIYRHIDRSQVQFDFLVFHSAKEFYEDEIESLGGNVYHVPVMEKANLLRQNRLLNEFFDEHKEYAVVHGHMAALGKSYFKAAKDHGVPCLFSHSHIADFENTPRGLVKHCFQRGFGEYATERFACSEAAGKYMYPGKTFQILKNGIDTELFSFKESRRKAFRKRLGVGESDLLIGHVGRFEYMKNHEFLIELFSKVYIGDRNAKLVLAGEGSLFNRIKTQVKKYGIANRVLFLGVVEDMPSFYDAIDVFVMPSRFEGFPFAVVEAQCSGVPCVLSSDITVECAITDLPVFIALDEGVAAWKGAINDALERNGERTAYSQTVKTAGYDILDATHRLMNLYLSCKAASS